MWRSLLAVSFCALLSAPSIPQEQIEKTFRLGDLAYVEAAEPCGWLCFDRAIQVERDGGRCYIRLEKPGTFKLAALSKKQVGDVVAYYTITTEGEAPPPIPPPTPVEVPNKYGLGAFTYAEAKAINKPDVAVQLYRVWGWAAQAMKEAKSFEQQSEIFSVQIQQRTNQVCGPEWDRLRSMLQTRFNQLQDSGTIGESKIEDAVAAMQEVSESLRIASGHKVQQ